MPPETVVADPTQTEAVKPPAADPAVLLGTEAPVLTADQTAAAEALASKAAADKATADAQAATDAKANADAKAVADAKALGAPDKYEFKAPEGQTYDSSLIAAFEAGAKDANLTQAVAQKLLDQMSPKVQELQVAQATAIRTGWAEASKTDTEFGGENLAANLGIAKKALDVFGSPELNKLLVSTGLGNHPEMIRIFYKAGKALSEDTFVPGTGPVRTQVSAASVLYDKTTT